MLTAAAARSLTAPFADTVCTYEALRSEGRTNRAVRSQVNARRWQRLGHAVIRHNGVLSWDEQCAAALINHGPRAVLTSFTGAGQFGLTGWDRHEVHVLVAAGARVLRTDGVRTHWTGNWESLDRHPVRPLHALAPSLLVAAGSFRSARPACGIIAAAVQQRLIRAGDLRRALEQSPRTHHRAQLLLAVGDVEQGAQALSEIDFARLCRRHGLPAPERQSVRRSPDGKRRYLDVEWLRPSGRRFVVEVDGAIHLEVTNWVTDQLRQNEVVIGGDPVLRFPSVIVRTEEAVVADQLRRGLDRWH